MAGNLLGLDPARFRSTIRAVMLAGLPNTAAARPTFHWHTAATFASADAAGRPWDFSATPTTAVPRPPVQVPCAVELTPAEAADTVLGTFDSDHARLTFLDEDWAAVAGFDWVDLDGVAYEYDQPLPTFALGPVDVIVCLVRTVDQ